MDLSLLQLPLLLWLSVSGLDQKGQREEKSGFHPGSGTLCRARKDRTEPHQVQGSTNERRCCLAPRLHRPWSNWSNEMQLVLGQVRYWRTEQDGRAYGALWVSPGKRFYLSLTLLSFSKSEYCSFKLGGLFKQNIQSFVHSNKNEKKKKIELYLFTVPEFWFVGLKFGNSDEFLKSQTRLAESKLNTYWLLLKYHSFHHLKYIYGDFVF